MDQNRYDRSGSVTHGGAADEVDFKDLTDQIDEYEKALTERMQAYHEDNNEAKYNQIQQMIGKISWLSRLALEKGQEQQQNILELNSSLQEKEQSIMTSQQAQQMLQDEMKRQQQQIDHLKAELQEAENLCQEKQELFQEASDTIEEMKSVNTSLQLQIDLSNKTMETKAVTDNNEVAMITQKLSQQITELTKQLEEKGKKEEKLQKKIESQRASLKEWEKNSKKIYKEIKHNEILQEKERYEMLLKIKEYKNKIATQGKELKTQESTISALKRKENEQQTKIQLASMHGTASFTNGSTNITPGAAGAQSPEVDPTGSIISQGGDPADPNIGHGLQAVAEEDGEGVVDGGLDFAEDHGLEDGGFGGNDELQGLTGELGNLENDFQATDDAAGDIINPMEDAEYYQGSFEQNDPEFGDLGIGDYRSQGSDEDDNMPPADLEVQEIDDPPEDVNLRQPDASITGEANGPTFTTPRTGLRISVDEEEEDEDANEVEAHVKISEMAEQVDNPYLLHYKNRSKLLKQELMGQPAAPATPTQGGGGDPQRDPEEEFFMLAVLALKMLHNEQYEDAEYVYEVSAAKLFRQVRSQQLPFHRWYKWLERKFADLREAFKRQGERNEEEMPLWQQKEGHQKEIEELNKRRPDSAKNKAAGFFNKLKKAMKKNTKKQEDVQSYARINLGHTPRKIDPSKLKQQQDAMTSAEKALQTISESMQDSGGF